MFLLGHQAAAAVRWSVARARRSLRSLPWVVVLACTALPTQAASVVVRDDQGVEHRFAAPPRRIVSLLPSLTESVCVLGGCARLVGVDRYSDWPAEVARLPRVGGLEDPAIETIATLRPDVVLASRWARSLDRLRDLGIPVLRLQAETHDDARRTLATLGALLGDPDGGERAWAAIERELAAAARRVPASARGQRVYFEIGGGPYAAGADSFIGQTLSRLGLGNVVPAGMPRFAKLNPEFVLEARPDWIIGERAHSASLERRPGWFRLPAIRQRQLCLFATPQYEILVRPGPRLGEAATLIAECLEGSAR